MGKRKGGTKVVREAPGPDMDVGSSRKRIRDYEDVAGSDDEFHFQRDEVLLGEAPDAKRRRKVQEEDEFLQVSDEEVLDYAESGSEQDEDEANVVDAGPNGHASDDDLDEQDIEHDDESETGWGTSKADLYGADAIETEEQALGEEAEALRLQKRQLQVMNAADYGFDEEDWQVTTGPAENEKAVVTEVLPQLLITESMTSSEKLKLLKSRYPEFEPLSKDMLQLQREHETLSIQAAGVKDGAQYSNSTVKLWAASSYLGALTTYFSLLASPAYNATTGVTAMAVTQLRNHPLMDSLVMCRDLWQRVQKLPSGENDTSSTQNEAIESTGNRSQAAGIEEMKPASGAKTVASKSRAQRAAEATAAAADARKAARLALVEADLADLDTLMVPNGKRKKSRISTAAGRDDDSDMGEEAVLTEREAADKALRKKSLRFYTSQIAQKANKRGAGGRNAGGDEDVPHRERLRDRQTRLNAEAENRGKRPDDGKADLGGESDEEDREQAKQIRDAVGAEDYYDLVAARTAKKKTDKAALAEISRQAALEGGRVVEQEVVGADGKRKISYLIEKNKGLTPHRKKDVRNPRVKKRKKYDEKKKKLASMKPTYKGGEGKGGYGGELTGIKSGLVKSTKL
ncbi:hypothetical protein LTR62_006057 [Meristemomyces frigidus]|uniref:Sas10 C-terminal domain-containing protein n=1 Tax=Meristemomyces frigidus TaxID=1508187 RepID=A0AAN7YEX1_9PEZI|nr:hypothetical protein LTR62_006057 [Meristemomyces frigidus]